MTMKKSCRTKSEPIFYNTEASGNFLDQPQEFVGHCQTQCNGPDTPTFCVNGDDRGKLPDTGDDDDSSQYVALDCEFVGVGPKLLSALGTVCLHCVC